jgi:hypothetical protein
VRSGVGAPIAGLLGVAVLLASAGTAFAQAEPIRLILAPIGQSGPYFDLTMRPGERRTLQVELGDAGSHPVAARTYAADVYTIVNGGFGGRHRDEAATGMTTWLNYPTAVVQLRPGHGVRRTFTIAVPRDAPAGEYITTIVLENDIPIPGAGAVNLDQVVRQAVAVVVTVPGPRVPALTIGAASHAIVGMASTVSVAVANPGNVRLKPIVAFTLSDLAGAEVGRARVAMDTFYAWTATTVEMPLVTILPPGQYTIRLRLEDDRSGIVVEEASIPLRVDAPAVVPMMDPLDGESGTAGAGVGHGDGASFLPLPVLIALAVAGGLTGLAVLGVLSRVRLRSRRT